MKETLGKIPRMLFGTEGGEGEEGDVTKVDTHAHTVMQTRAVAYTKNDGAQSTLFYLSK